MQKKDEQLVKRILEYLNKTFLEENRVPTVQEIADEMGIAKSSASRYLAYMRDNGLVESTERYNGIRTNTMKKIIDSKVRAPILGNISCGQPLFAEENIEGYITLPEDWVGGGNFFCLWAHGDSMINAGIKQGDLVICRQQNVAEEGQIVVALCDNENATLKRYYLDRKNKGFRLHPENDTMEDMFYKDVQIQGIAVKVLSDIK